MKDRRKVKIERKKESKKEKKENQRNPDLKERNIIIGRQRK